MKKALKIQLPELSQTRERAFKFEYMVSSQSAFACSKLIIETLEQGVKYVQS